jgi:hypothetical protein
MAEAAAPIVIVIVMAGATVAAMAGRVRNRAGPQQTVPPRWRCETRVMAAVRRSNPAAAASNVLKAG